jgi:hypothetical protein
VTFFIPFALEWSGMTKEHGFWEDHWIGDEPVEIKYRNRYDICENKGIVRD